jgi:hypothetical protein
MNKNLQRRLAEGTASWLAFEFICNRGDLFSEKQLVTPVGQILISNFGSHKSRIKTEVSHTVLKKQKGRPLQLDFVLMENTAWKLAVETKWVAGTMISLESIIWDLIRLELTAKQEGCPVYFVLAGFAKKIKQVLKNTHFIDGPHSLPMVTQKGRQLIRLDLTKLPQIIKEHINKKMVDFPSITIPRKLYFEFPHSYPIDKVNMTFETIVWKVNHESQKPRLSVL